MILTTLTALLASQLNTDLPPPLRVKAPPAFSAFTASGAGVDTPETLCSNFTAADQAGAWLCMNGDGSFVNQTLTKTGSDTDATGYVCGGGDVLMAARNPGGTSGARWSAASSRVGAANYTTCAHVVPIAAAAEQPVLTWASGGSGAQLGISPFVTAAATGFSTYMANGSPCNSITAYTHTTALVPGAAALLCVRVSDTATDVDMFVNGIKYTPTTVCTACGCDDGTAQTYSVNSYGGSATSGNASRILGAFATETALSDARIQAISAAVLGVTPTDAKGGAITNARTTGATATKGGYGLRLTGILDEEMVACGPNQQRQVRNTDGLVGALGEGTAHPNSLQQTDAFDNAAWQQNGSAGRAPTVTANFAPGPFAGVRAERLQLPACSGGSEFSRIFQNFAPGYTTASASVYLKGNAGTSGVLMMTVLTSFPAQNVTCSFNGTSWTRCVLENFTATAAGENLYIGFHGSGGPWAAIDVLVASAQFESGDHATSYRPATSVAVTQAAETVAVSGVTVLTTSADFSFAETFSSRNAPATCAGYFPISSVPAVGANIYTCFTTGFHARTQATGFADSPNPSPVSWLNGIRWGVIWDKAATKTAALVNGVATAFGSAGPAVASATWGTMYLQGDGVHSNLCGHQDMSRCR